MNNEIQINSLHSEENNIDFLSSLIRKLSIQFFSQFFVNNNDSKKNKKKKARANKLR